jgi:predicted ATPase/DNA-binding SARP family transcriptional activator
MAQLQLFLFGPPRLEHAGETLTISPRKAVALLVYLAVSVQPHSRDALATLFWPESDQTTARAALRRTLHRLQQALPQTLLKVTPETIQLDPQAGLASDVADFRAALKADLPALVPADELAPERYDRLRAAVGCYRDDFMAGFTLEDCPAFDEWQFFQREELRDALGRALHQLEATATRAADWPAAIEAARRRLALDALAEPVHRDLMQLYAWAGQQAAALRQYQECCRILDGELGAPPEPETTALYDAIRTKRAPSPPVTGAATSAPSAPQSTPPVAQAEPPAPKSVDDAATNRGDDPAPRRHAIPLPQTTFVGRAQEVVGIIQTLLHPDCRLLTLVGLGGIGKTRLAIQVAHRLAAPADPSAVEHFPDGVVFVQLATVSDPEEIVPAIVEAAGWHFAADIPLRRRLLATLRDRRMLLVLDNYDHLLGAVDLIAELLAHAPALKVLVTSRVALPLAEAWFYPLGGMSFPAADDPAPERFEAVQLFVQCARRARSDFTLETAREAVARICRLVTGMPLAIELAAAWLRGLPVDAVAAELAHGLDILSSRYMSMPERHRSMRVVIDQSWALLEHAEREVYQQLAVLRGGFSLLAAQAIAGATLSIITTLVEKSLLVVEGERYTMHELLRQFALEKLERSPKVAADTYERFSAYYLEFLEARMEPMARHEQPTALAEINAEAENIAGGWQWALAHGDLAALERALFSYNQYFWLLGRAQAGLHLFGNTLRTLDESPAARSHPRFAVLRQMLLRVVGMYHYYLGQFAPATTHLEAALAAANHMGDRRAAAEVMTDLATIAIWQGRRAAAVEFNQAALAAHRAAGNRDGEADILHKMARLALFDGDWELARRYATDSLQISLELGRPDWIGFALVTIGTAVLWRGDYAEARRCYAEALQVFNSINYQVGIAVTLGGQAWLVWAEEGPTPEAEQLAQRSLHICRQIGNRVQIAHRLAQLAQLTNDRGDYSATFRYTNEGIAMAKELGNPLYHSQNLCCHAEAVYRRGDYVSARRHLAQAAQLAADAGALSRLTMAALHAGQLLLAQSTQTGQLPDPALAAECLVWAARHPATWQILRGRSLAALAELRGCAAEAVAAAEALPDVALQERITAALAAWAADA